MLIFATSDKGGTGRSVTSSNVLYRSALQGSDVCYLDFDFGSPTSGAIFNIPNALHGTTQGGLHSYLHGVVADPQRLEIWSESDRSSLRSRPPGAGRLVLLPGDSGGGEFPITKENTERCARLFLHLEEEFDLCLVDLSAGRSYATEMVLAATAMEPLRNIRTRWLVFHRWTRQHVLAAAGLVYGERGILDTGVRKGHDREELANTLRFVRTAVVNPDSPELEGLRPAQVAWLRDVDRDLSELASSRKVGRTLLLGQIPLDPVLQWREQLISDNDVWSRRIANRETLEQFDSLAKKIVDDAAWETL
ncbi:SCO2523 family variant P-loop protein [Asanoa sp. NPDC050611]|uniref:SCO2523 family variant P-loop protein n=1 Tax=Asanoa sp. NPDC050611 TaxID=3157098 RepID=UPI0033FD9A77